MADDSTVITVSISELEAERAELAKRADRARKHVQVIERRAADIEVTLRVLARRRRKGDPEPAGKKLTTPDMVLQVLRGGGIYTVPNLTEAMFESGFSTTSKRPADIVRTALHRLLAKGRVYRDGQRWGAISGEQMIL